MMFLKIPMVRHLLAGISIIGLLYFFSIAPLQQENKNLQKYIFQLAENQQVLIKEMAKKDTYKIENKVSDVKVKKGGEIKLTPDNDLSVLKASSDSVKTEKVSLWKRWFGKH